MPDPESSAACEPEAVREGRPGADRLISVGDIRVLFKPGRTAAYELTPPVRDVAESDYSAHERALAMTYSLGLAGPLL